MNAAQTVLEADAGVGGPEPVRRDPGRWHGRPGPTDAGPGGWLSGPDGGLRRSVALGLESNGVAVVGDLPAGLAGPKLPGG